MVFNGIILGYSRSGSTSLYHYITQHKSVCGGRIKEPKFFTRNITQESNGPGDTTVRREMLHSLSEFHENYRGCEQNQVLIEASSDSIYYIEDIWDEILNFTDTSTLFLVCLRNPVARCFSAYSNLVRDSRETFGFIEALELEAKRIEQGYDLMWHYTNGSMLYDNLNFLLKRGIRLKLVFIEDLNSDPQNVCNEIFDMLGVARFKIDPRVKYSVSSELPKYVSLFLRRDIKFIGYVRQLLRKIVPVKIAHRILQKYRTSEHNHISYKLPEKIVDKFEEDLLKTRSLLVEYGLKEESGKILSYIQELQVYKASKRYKQDRPNESSDFI